jgi:hypothetical protein
MVPHAADPSGPVFISYRWSDGTDDAREVAQRLRASGVPVWLDPIDLPPGETFTRLEEALASGISGAVLISTPDIALGTVGRLQLLNCWHRNPFPNPPLTRREAHVKPRAIDDARKSAEVRVQLGPFHNNPPPLALDQGLLWIEVERRAGGG